MTTPQDRPSPPGSDPAPREAAERGRLVINQKVVEKVASQAASEISVVGGSSGGVLGLGRRADLTSRPKVGAELSGRQAVLDLDLTVRYPTPLRQATDRVRRHLMARVHELTGVTVTRVDIAVVSLSPTGTDDTEGGLR